MRFHGFLVVPTFVAVVSSLPSGAWAHLELTSPPSRYGGEVLKDGPCGHPDNPPGTNRRTFEPGETITVRWTEYVDHPGWYRIAFDEDGDDAFVDPADASDLWNSPAVILDEIADKDGGDYAVEVTLPDMECERCTLQVLQVMTDKTGNGWGNDEFYYQCADLRLSGDASGTTGGEDTGDPATGGDASGSTTGGDETGDPGGDDTSGVGSTTGTTASGGSDSSPGSGSDSASDSTGEGDESSGCAVTGPRSGSAIAVLLPLGACLVRRRRSLS